MSWVVEIRAKREILEAVQLVELKPLGELKPPRKLDPQMGLRPELERLLGPLQKLEELEKLDELGKLGELHELQELPELPELQESKDEPQGKPLKPLEECFPIHHYFGLVAPPLDPPLDHHLGLPRPSPLLGPRRQACARGHQGGALRRCPGDLSP